MSTYNVKVSGYVRRNGVRYAPGDVIEGLSEREAQSLVKLDVVETVTKVDAASSSSPVQTPPDPSTPQGIVAMSAAEAVEHIAEVDNVKFLRAIEALEDLRDKPRATVLRAIEARRNELEPPAPTDPPVGSPSNEPSNSSDGAADDEAGGSDDD